MSARFEPRLMDPVGQAPAMWGAWDHRHDDWSREPSMARNPRVFVTEERVLQWAARQEPVQIPARPPVGRTQMEITMSVPPLPPPPYPPCPVCRTSPCSNPTGPGHPGALSHPS